MAIIFGVLTAAIVSALLNQRLLSMILIAVALVSALGVFWHHVTNVLQINL